MFLQLRWFFTVFKLIIRLFKLWNRCSIFIYLDIFYLFQWFKIVHVLLNFIHMLLFFFFAIFSDHCLPIFKDRRAKTITLKRSFLLGLLNWYNDVIFKGINAAVLFHCKSFKFFILIINFFSH